jgi:apolipoprotein D and lipocalin family protein
MWNPQQETLQADFELDRYLGEWFEIAKLPNFFEIGCASAKARYDKLSETVISVINTCLNEFGECTGRKMGRQCIAGWLQGQGRVVNPAFPAALKVEFPTFADPSPIPNYLVHATDYTRFAVVGSPDRSTLFILARRPVMLRPLYRRLLRFSQQLGYDVDNIIINTRGGRPVVVSAFQ